MAITKLTFPTAGTPSVNTDYNLQNALTEALIKQGQDAYKLTNYKVLSASAPAISIGTYIRHQNACYLVDTADYTILGSTAAGMNYIKLSGTGTTITATWTQTVSGFSYDEIKNGWYDGSGDQILMECVYKTSGGNFLNYKMRDNQSGATIILAASDSSLPDKLTADVVCDGTADDVEIQAAIDLVNGQGGGTVELKTGIYDIDAQMSMKADVILKGFGDTELKAGSAITSIFDFSISGTAKADIYDIVLNGNSNANYGIQGTTKCISRIVGCKAIGCVLDGFNFVDGLSGCYSVSNGRNGFGSCDRLTNCYASLNTDTGFMNCDYMTSCEGYDNTQNGFEACEGISACSARSNDLNGFYGCGWMSACKANGHSGGYSYRSCHNMSDCYHTGAYGGFYLCNDISDCFGTGGTYIFRECERISTSKGFSSSSHIFYACTACSNCEGSTSTSGYGFHSCYPLSLCKATSNGGGTYSGCYANWGGSVAVADTYVGGWNG